jgi:TPR repeat protein
MRKFILHIILLLVCLQAKAQDSQGYSEQRQTQLTESFQDKMNSKEVNYNFEQDRYSLREIMNVLRNSNNVSSRERALADLAMYAEEGNVEAMYILGKIYFENEANFELAKYWFKKASSLNESKSDFALAMMYRTGTGVEQSFETALQYLKKAEKSRQTCRYTSFLVGYFYYKGLGGEQNYQKAVKYFERAALYQHEQAMFMLALCYRNGYGVERDIARGNFWLERLNRLSPNNRSVEFELAADSPERPLQAVRMRSVPEASQKRNSETHHLPRRKVKHSINVRTNITGNYTGALITYDWSGKYPLSENALNVTFEQNGRNVLVRWIEEDATEMEATATLTDTALIFKKAIYRKKDHFHRDVPREWNFKQATLSYINEDGQILLSGNLQLYCPITKEPQKPIYLVLQPQQTIVSGDSFIADTDLRAAPTHNTQCINAFVYPNPFTDYLNVSFTLEKEDYCEINIYSLSGVLMSRQNLGKLEQGIHRYQINVSAYTAGSYVLRLTYGDQSYTNVIIKK